MDTWHDFGYENPPTPDCKSIPRLGERSAEAIKGVQAAIGSIDGLTRQLHALRARLVSELRIYAQARRPTAPRAET